MAGIIATASFDSVALTAATAKTVVQLTAPTNQRLKLVACGLYFDGTTATNASVLCELVRQTTAGTATSVTLVKNDPGVDETLQATASKNASAEPTTTDTLLSWRIHPQGGGVQNFTDYLGTGQYVAGGGRIGVRLTAANNVNVSGYLKYEE